MAKDKFFDVRGVKYPAPGIRIEDSVRVRVPHRGGRGPSRRQALERSGFNAYTGIKESNLSENLTSRVTLRQKGPHERNLTSEVHEIGFADGF